VLLLEGCSGPEELRSLLESPAFARIRRLVESNYKEYDRIYEELVHEFNRRSLPAINYGFSSTPGELKSLSVESLRAQAKGRHIFHAHLGQLLQRRLAKLRDQRRAIDPEAERLDELGAAELRRRYFDPLYGDILARGEFMRADKLYAAVREVEAERGARVVRVAYTRPLTNDLGSCVQHLIANAGDIDALEVWNNRVKQEGYSRDTLFLEELRRALNAGDADALHGLLDSRSMEGVDEEEIARAAERYRRSPLEARVGSDSDGYNHLAPGMGFLPRRAVRNWRAVLRTNRSTPLPLTLPLPDGGAARRESVILPLGKDRGAAARQRVGERALSAVVGWRDLNSAIRNGSRMLGGAVLALAAGEGLSLATGFPPAFGLFTVIAFFAITYVRNFVVDESARHGLHPSRWRWSSFDTTNAANSVFFSLLSIPLLRFVEQLFDRVALVGEGASADMGSIELRLLRFILLALVNGVYMYSHNTLRGFTAGVKRANFWRSVLAFPLATAFSYLNPWNELVSGTLISKVASDIIGGLTEMTFKIIGESRRARQLYAALLPSLRGRPETKREKYLQRIAILDTLYIWGNSPRGKEALRRAIQAESEPKVVWDRLETPVRRYENFVTLITDKTSWRKPQRIKLEFLRLAAAFSYWLERNRPAESGSPQ